MMDVNRYHNHTGFPSVFVCPSSVPAEQYATQDLFNPVYEELSNGSGDGRGETDSEGGVQAPISEDEFAEDELSLGGEVETVPEAERRSGSSSLQGSTGNDLCRDVDSSDADDRSRFLVNQCAGRNFSLPPGYRDKVKRTQRGGHSHHASTERRPKSLDRRRGWRNKVPPPPPHGPPECTDFHEGVLLDALLQFYPSVNRQHRTPYLSNQADQRHANPYESVPVLSNLHQHHHTHHPRQEIFTTFRPPHAPKQQHSQDSSFGSDSGYSNNTSGGRASSRGRKDNRLSNHSDLVLS